VQGSFDSAGASLREVPASLRMTVGLWRDLWGAARSLDFSAAGDGASPVSTHAVVRCGQRPYNLSVMSSTASLPEIPHSNSNGHRRNPALRVLYYTVCLLLVALIAGVWWLYWIARLPLPQLDGSVSVSGISSKVRVMRDEQGVPTIQAATLEDLFFAQGYVTAQDRLWQMDMLRRAAAGELSEIIGEDTVKMDREQRILGLRIAAEAAEKNISARDRGFLDAYARGVNAFSNRIATGFRSNSV